MSLILVIQQAFEVLGHLTEACGVNRRVPRREWGRLHWGRRFPIEFPVHPGAAPNGRHAEGHTADAIQRLQCLRSYHAHPNHPPERVGHSPSAPSRAPRIRVRSSRGGAQTRWQEARREWWADLETYQTGYTCSSSSALLHLVFGVSHRFSCLVHNHADGTNSTVLVESPCLAA